MSPKALAKNAAVIIATLVIFNQISQRVPVANDIRRLAGLS